MIFSDVQCSWMIEEDQKMTFLVMDKHSKRFYYVDILNEMGEDLILDMETTPSKDLRPIDMHNV